MSAADHRPPSPAGKIAYGGILAACTILTLFLATTLPTNRIFFYGLSSIFTALMILEYGTAAGGLFYLATSLLALIVIPDKIRLIPYIFILGHYPIWKTYLEKQKSRVGEILLKLLVLDAGTLAAYYVFTALFLGPIALPGDLKLIFSGLQILFLIYDYVFTLLIRFYLDRIKPMIHP